MSEKYTKEEFAKRFLGVHNPCDVCQGLGKRWYGNTSTWRKSIGGASMTIGVCDSCWGSGDKNRKGEDLRELTKQRYKWEADQCLEWFRERTGAQHGLAQASL